MRATLALYAVLILLASAPGGAQRERPSPAEEAAKRLFRSDARLVKPLTVEMEKALGLADGVRQIEKQLGVDLAVQGDLFNRPFTMQVKERKASDILTDLALLFGGTWVRRGTGYVLLTDEETAALFRSKSDRIDLQKAMKAVAASLTMEQRAVLQRRLPINFKQLSPVQQRLAGAVLREEFLEFPDRHPMAIATGAKVVLAWSPVVDPQIGAPTGASLEFHGPTIGPDRTGKMVLDPRAAFASLKNPW